MVLHRGLNESVNLLLGPVHVELLEQECERVFEIGRNRIPHIVRQCPEVALERPNGLLAGLVIELLVRVAALSLACGVLVQPGS